MVYVQSFLMALFEFSTFRFFVCSPIYIRAYSEVYVSVVIYLHSYYCFQLFPHTTMQQMQGQKSTHPHPPRADTQMAVPSWFNQSLWGKVIVIFG